MRYVEAAGLRLSAIGLGTWQFGSREWGYGEDYLESTAGRIVRRALDLGVNLVDTAEIYAFGESERVVGREIASRRDEVFIATKMFPLVPVSPVVQWRGVQSAVRLGVKKIDLYQVHWPNPVVPLPTTMAGMRSLVDCGLVANVGVSNFSADMWRRAENRLGLPVVSNQVEFSLAFDKHSRPGGNLSYAQRQDRIVIAYSPLAKGLLGGRYDVDHPPTGAVRESNPLFMTENLERAAPLLHALRDVASRYGVTPAQVALAWLIHHPNVVAIPGASSVEQLERNVEAADIALAPDDFAWLSDEAARFEPIRGLGAIPLAIAERVSAGGDTHEGDRD